jgi:hypothetical protein
LQHFRTGSSPDSCGAGERGARPQDDRQLVWLSGPPFVFFAPGERNASAGRESSSSPWQIGSLAD